jgi:DMSO/TMAO reductase YedYZ heme-binding membrane subunit
VSVKRGRSTGRSRADWHGTRYAHPAAAGGGQWSWALFSGFALAVFVGVLIIAGINRTGHTIDMDLMRFMLFYAGVFALIGLTAAVGVGLLASDRIFMTPSGRIIAQAVHRAVSFGAVGFLLIHIVTEIIAGRSRATAAVVPFLDPGRTLYLGLGTIASDLFLLILVTGILRARFATVRPTWAWRALHSVAYLAWVMGILHGLLAGRAAKPYVDWSYGACVAAVGLALIVRVVAAGRVREVASTPVPEAPPWLTAGGASPWLPGGTVSMLDQAPAPPRAVSPRPPLALPAPPPRAITAYPEPAGDARQPSERVTGAHQSPERVTGPQRYPERAAGPQQYPERGTGARQPPDRVTGPHRYPERPAGPQQYPERPAGPQQYPERVTGARQPPDRVTGPQQYPERVTGAGQSPERPTGPHRYPERVTGARQSPDRVTSAQQYPGRVTGPSRYPGRNTGGYQYPERVNGGHQYAAGAPQYAASAPEYAGPGDPTGYYEEPDDEDYDSEWADAEDLDAGDYDFEPHAGDDDGEWAGAGDYGPGPGTRPGRPHPQGGASHFGWTR